MLIKIKAKTATSFLDKALGLLRPQNPRFMIFYTRFGIHTFFLKSPIDVLVLNHEKNVVSLVSCLQPNRFFFYPPCYRTVVEMPQGSICKLQIRLNDKILLE